jgi:hypothetical protein
MRRTVTVAAAFSVMIFTATIASAQINFSKNGYYDNGLVSTPVLDPVTGQPCRALSKVTILVSNYYSIPHPDPLVFAQLDAALRGFDQALRFVLPSIHVPTGSKVAMVDLYSPSLDRQGLVTIQRRLGLEGPFAFDIHPTNLGHTFIAQQFKKALLMLQE